MHFQGINFQNFSGGMPPDPLALHAQYALHAVHNDITIICIEACNHNVNLTTQLLVATVLGIDTCTHAHTRMHNSQNFLGACSRPPRSSMLYKCASHTICRTNSTLTDHYFIGFEQTFSQHKCFNTMFVFNAFNIISLYSINNDYTWYS